MDGMTSLDALVGLSAVAIVVASSAIPSALFVARWGGTTKDIARAPQLVCGRARVPRRSQCTVPRGRDATCIRSAFAARRYGPRQWLLTARQARVLTVYDSVNRGRTRMSRAAGTAGRTHPRTVQIGMLLVLVVPRVVVAATTCARPCSNPAAQSRRSMLQTRALTSGDPRGSRGECARDLPSMRIDTGLAAGT
jgi:hypothetical protein